MKLYVAIKFILSESPEMVNRFLQEVCAQAKVDHENACKIYEPLSEGGKHYIVLQYIEGTALSVAARTMTLEQKVLVMKKVAEAIISAHRQGLIHRDIKPGNIMIQQTEDGELRPFVLDFALARD